MVVSDYVILTSIWLLYCWSDSAWAAAKRAEVAKQLGKIVELQE